MKPIKIIRNLNSEIEVSGSKSYTNRALIISSLARGKTILKKPLISDDTKHMINALRLLGVKIKIKDSEFEIMPKALHPAEDELFIGNSGTSARFLTAFAALIPGKTKITGEKRMQQRPIKELLFAIEQLGIKYQCESFCPPLEIKGGTLVGGDCEINGEESSQYLTAILMIAPYSQKDITIKIKGELSSKPFVDMTIDIMKKFGVKVENENYKTFIIKAGQRYRGGEYTIEADMTAASYFFAAPAIVGGTVRVKNINPDTKQGDINFIYALEKMGCKINKGKDFIEVSKTKELKPIEIDMNSMPDVAQTLAVTALFANGTTKIRNIANLRIKETDRIKATVTELRKLGAKVIESDSGMIIQPPVNGFKPARIKTYNDHRMAMSFALTGLRIPGIKIENPECVNKTFPEFWKTFEKLK